MNVKMEFNGEKPEISEEYVCLLRLMQGKNGNKNKNLEDIYKEAKAEYGLSRDTFKRRLEELRGISKLKQGPARILGAEVVLKIGEDNKENGTRTKIEDLNSTCHPIFLPLNVTQVAVMLMGLYYACRMKHTGKKYRNVAFKEACYVWAQLTDYCRELVKEFYSNEIPGFAQWLKRLKIDLPLKFENDEWVSIGQKNIDSHLISIMKAHKKGRGEADFCVVCEDGHKFWVRHPMVRGELCRFEDALYKGEKPEDKKYIRIEIEKITEIIEQERYI